MNRNISDTIAPLSAIPIVGEITVKVTRWDGRVEEKKLINTVTVAGLNRIALNAVHSAGGVFNSLIVGTATAAPALTNSQSSMGEVSRKTSINLNGSAQSREWIFLTATWGGAADSVTSVVLDSAGISIGASSLATSLLANRVNGMGVTLANSDLLHLTARIRVGSHDVAHT
jgi:hypothetical protein